MIPPFFVSGLLCATGLIIGGATILDIDFKSSQIPVEPLAEIKAL